MKKIFSLLATLSLIVTPLVGRAATVIVPGDLIKASGSTVYYVGNNLKRFVFPTEKTYFSWYIDFSTVKTISDGELASLPLGGNVTYRPGTSLLKVTTDPKTYAVSKGGVLRWVQTEAAAVTLYGSDWNKKVDDLPDAFFINYTIGSPVASANDYSPVTEQTNDTSINVDKNLVEHWPPPPTNPASTTTTTTSQTIYVATIVSSNNTPKLGETVILTANAAPAGASVVNIFFNNVLQRTCDHVPCSVDVPVPQNGLKTAYEARAEITWLNNHKETAISYITPTSQSAGATISITHPEIRPNSIQELVATVNSDFLAHFLDIYVDGNDVRGCNNSQQCRYSFTETSALGTTHSVYTVAQDANGFKRTSATMTYTVVNDDHPLASVITGKNIIFKGETVDASMTATDDDGIAWTELWLDGSMIKHCASGTCSAIAGPWSQSRTVYFVGKAQDTTGLVGYATSSPVTVQ